MKQDKKFVQLGLRSGKTGRIRKNEEYTLDEFRDLVGNEMIESLMAEQVMTEMRSSIEARNSIWDWLWPATRRTHMQTLINNAARAGVRHSTNHMMRKIEFLIKTDEFGRRRK